MKLQFRYRFEAAHRFLSSSSLPCKTPHGHSWYATMTVAFKSKVLNDNQMSVEFSAIKTHWKNLIDQTFDHSYMHHHKDPVAELLIKETPSPRLVSFPGDPTTELISLLMFHKMKLIIDQAEFSDLVEIHQIAIEETPTNTVVCDKDFYTTSFAAFSHIDGWWSTSEIKNHSASASV